MTKKEPSTIVTYWLNELKASRKREERYRKIGKEVFELYEADKEGETPFNILYSNTETLRPALYSAQPRPVVDRRFKDDDPLGKLASDADRRMLEYHLDTNREDYETLNEAMGAAVLDALLPGRGGLMLKYDADFVPIPEPRPPDDQDDAPVKDQKEKEQEPGYYAENEQVCYESIIWDRFYLGYAKKWTKVPWIAYQFFLTKEEVAAQLGEEIATKLTYSSSQETDDDSKSSRKNSREDETGERRTACIYQIWDKAGGKKVVYVSPNYTDDLLKEEDDPLGLTGFFNTPRPLMFVEKSCSLVPTAPYKMYKSQADELNRLTRRIKRITEAIKARGIYDGSMGGDLEKLMEKDDNALVPAEVTSILSTEKGFASAIWFLPIDVLIAVLQQLYQARESCKQTIYEITGIADIMRGATNASETLGAQQIKNQWGTLRLKRMQTEVARYVRDVLRMTSEIAAKRFDQQTWASMTNLPFLTDEQMQQLQQQAAVIAQMPQPLPPPAQQQQAQLQQAMSQPVWSQVLQILQSEKMRAYRIDIETNSTVQPEAAEDQEAITQLLTAFGQTMQSIGPLVLQGVLPFQAAQSLLLFIARRYRFGSEIEDKIQAMQPPKPQDNGQAKEAEMQQKQNEMDKQMGLKEIDHRQKQAEMAIQQRSMQADMDHQKRSNDLDMREMALQVKEHQFGMQQQVEKGMLDMHKQHATNELVTKQKQSDLDRKAQALKAEKNGDGDVKQLLTAIMSRLENVEKLLGKAA